MVQINNADAGMENIWNKTSDEPRTPEQIRYLEDILSEKIWYTQYLWMCCGAEKGHEPASPESWAMATKDAERIAAKHGAENLGPYNAFDLGVRHGMLEALRWVRGSELEFPGS